METRICSSCKIEKDKDQFNASAQSYGGFSYYCKKCNNVKVKKYCEDHVEDQRVYNKMYREKHKKQIQKTAKEYRKSGKGRWYDLKKRDPLNIIPREEFVKWFDEKSNCEYCKISVQDFKKLNPKERPVFEIDRKDNSLGYILGNLALACPRCNRGKSNLFTYEEWTEIAIKYIMPKIENKINTATPS